MRFSHTLSTYKHYVYSTIIVFAMTLFLAGCPSPNDPAPNDSKPLLTITPTRASVTEGGTSTFTITRNNVEGALEVSLTLSGSAEHNVDYTVDPTVNTGDKTMTVVFENSKKSVDITITAKNDVVPDTGEEVVITIKESGDYTIGDPPTATLTIVDPAPSDAPVVSISTSTSTSTSDENNAVNEGGTITVTISSSKEVSNGLEVSLTIGGDATIDEDYALPGVTTTTLDDTVTATVTINDGEKSATITIPVHDDNDHEEDETVVMSVDPSSNYHINNGEESATVTILNDDLPTVGFRTTSQTLQEGDDEGVTVIVERSTDKVRDPLTVQLKIEGDVESVSDYETLSDTVTFKSGEDIATITLTAGDDGTKEEEQRVIITIETSDGYTVGDSRTATVTIIDPVVAGSPTISISASPSEVNEGEDITITVRSNIPVTEDLMVSFTIDDVTNSAQQGDDYALDPESNTVTINDGSDSATITIRVHDDDDDDEKNEDIQITISDSSSYYIKEGEKTVTVTITEDSTDLPTVSIGSDVSIQEGRDATLTLTRSNDKVLAPLKVQLSFAGSTANEGEDYTGLTTTASFREGSDEVTITLTAEDDVIREATETVVITIIDESPSTYRSKEGEETVTVTITDDDLPTVSIGSDVSIQEGNDATLTLTRSNDEVRDPLTVKLSFEGTAGSDDYTVSTTIASFGEGSDEVTITLTAEENDIHEGAKTVVITIIDSDTYTVGDSRTATVTITDDDLPIVGFRTTSQRLDEGDGESVTVTVERSNDEVRDSLAVQLTIEGGAENGKDYKTLSNTVTFQNGEDTATITLIASDDGDAEGNEEVIITISEIPDAYTIDEENSKVTITIVDDEDTDGDMIPNSVDVDDDNDGLIEIHNLDMLRNVHFNLAGTSYDDEEDDVGTGDPGDTSGGPTESTDHCSTLVNDVFLCGYELMHDLDFNDANSYDTINTEWRPSDADSPEENPDDATNEGFPGIGAATGTSGGFTGIFEGNGHSISNLYMRNTTDSDRYFTGLFRRTEAGAKIRNLGMINVAIYGGTWGYNRVGGLVGGNSGDITASYASGTVDGGAGGSNLVGGLVGVNDGTITASYASGTVDGGTGGSDRVGGLVGYNNGTITASYATGDVDGGVGSDLVGGLVGWNSHGDITASYATGDVDGGAGSSVGGLVGHRRNDRITASYGFGTHSGGTVNSDGTPKPENVNEAFDLTKDNAGTEWNNAGRNTLGAWDFGDTSQNPALKYADYDDAGTTYSCGPVPACGSLLPEQGR